MDEERQPHWSEITADAITVVLSALFIGAVVVGLPALAWLVNS